MAGAFFLGEIFTFREALAGRRFSLISKGYICLLTNASVVSLVGVVLIARPTAIFGSHAHVPGIPVTDGLLTSFMSPVEKGTQAERLIAVG